MANKYIVIVIIIVTTPFLIAFIYHEIKNIKQANKNTLNKQLIASQRQATVDYAEGLRSPDFPKIIPPTISMDRPPVHKKNYKSAGVFVDDVVETVSTIVLESYDDTDTSKSGLGIVLESVLDTMDDIVSDD